MNSGRSTTLKKNQLKMSLNFLSQISWQVPKRDCPLFRGSLNKLLPVSLTGEKSETIFRRQRVIDTHLMIINLDYSFR
jgi:hypothetical protein